MRTAHDLDRKISLTVAARSLQGRNGRGVPIGLVYRWCLHGVRGVKLQAVRIDGRRACEKETIQALLRTTSIKAHVARYQERIERLIASLP
jgi:hypothetical protein